MLDLNNFTPNKETENGLLDFCTIECLKKTKHKMPKNPEDLEYSILDTERKLIEMHNVNNGQSYRFSYRKVLTNRQLAIIGAYYFDIRFISLTGTSDNPDDSDDNRIIGTYQKDGPNAGTYSLDEKILRRILRGFHHRLTDKNLKEVISELEDLVPRVNICTDRDLIIVNNGIFNYRTKRLDPFTPDKVFLRKPKVDYNPFAKNITIRNDEDGTDWDVESWISEMMGDAEVTQSVWEIIGAVVRPTVPWNKSAWFYSEAGNSGKGTLCELMRQLCGEGSYVALQLADMGKDFALEPLLTASAIINDENDVGQYIDKAANIKALITNDDIYVSRKFLKSVTFKFHGFMVQCLNEFPRIKDKTGSLYRRALFIPFPHSYTGEERPYIKDDYIHRKEVLEYVLKKVLMSNYYTLSEPTASKQIMSEFKEYNDPVRLFVREVIPQCVWDLLPFSFLYELYKEWMDRNMPQGSKLGNPGFIQDLLSCLDEELPGWYCRGKDVQVRTGHKMDKPEPLIWRYQLKDWMNPGYRSSSDLNKLCLPQLAASYRGLLRMPADGTIPDNDKDTE